MFVHFQSSLGAVVKLFWKKHDVTVGSCPQDFGVQIQNIFDITTSFFHLNPFDHLNKGQLTPEKVN